MMIGGVFNRTRKSNVWNILIRLVTAIGMAFPVQSNAGILEDLTGAGIKIIEYFDRRSDDQKVQPAILTCLRDISYWRDGSSKTTHGDVHKIKGWLTITLYNVVDRPITVTSISITIAGKWNNGQTGGMGQQIAKIEKQVPAGDSLTISRIPFSSRNIVTNEKYWIEKPEIIHLEALLPGIPGTSVNAIPVLSAYNPGGGKWVSRIRDTSDANGVRTLSG